MDLAIGVAVGSSIQIGKSFIILCTTLIIYSLIRYPIHCPSRLGYV